RSRNPRNVQISNSPSTACSSVDKRRFNKTGRPWGRPGGFSTSDTQYHPRLRWPCRNPSEVEFQAELKVSRLESRPDHSERGYAEAGSRNVERRMVRGIERLEPEFDPCPFGWPEAPKNCQVYVEQPGTFYDSASRIAVRVLRRNSECRRVEPMLRAALVRRQVRIPERLRPLIRRCP